MPAVASDVPPSHKIPHSQAMDHIRTWQLGEAEIGDAKEKRISQQPKVSKPGEPIHEGMARMLDLQ